MYLYIGIVQGTINIKRKILQYCDCFSVISCKLSTGYQLSNDIEKNPGPSILYVDPSKTTQAPYSHADVVVFGQNARQQCVAVSVYLIYHNMKGN